MPEFIYNGLSFDSEQEYLDERKNAGNAEEAARRVTFQLNYGRTPQRREFGPGELTGPAIPCAYAEDGVQTGGWERPEDGIPGGVRSVEEWIDRFANYAVAEGVHEVLEYFRVDGRPWLDPHGAQERDIHALVDKFVEDLAALCRRR
ncbi:hypothetical protein [Catenuloplanes atrovinosus]|uniref:Uncharacterized protein n=1 Tax=Catenuloplanes atrovinosus TaxID=137266 RepID=A0AAE3YR59_9ACTN|nr:hypothetical protein [Catenuloplanes atrovinosus]MDR7277732.1 hypothetical protein [Catenuloplanes atrovinosus]